MTNPAGAHLLCVHSRLLGSSDDQFDVLAHWVAEVAGPSGSLIDIGAGDGDDAYLRLIRPLVAQVVGVDPDPHAVRHDNLDALYQMGIEEYAARFTSVRTNRAAVRTEAGIRLPQGDVPQLFDLALAIYVVEHLSDTVPFFSAARACLRPGRSLFVITPNLWHYFGVLAKAATALGLEDRLLGVLRSHHPGHRHVAHFPVAYRANSVRALRRIGAEAGFSRLEIRHLENPAVFETYFPGKSVAFPRAYSRLVHLIGRPELFGTLICRFVN